MWTRFHDCHTNGLIKCEGFEDIYIEGGKADAVAIFTGRFQFDPEQSACSCCGQDYDITTGDFLGELSYYSRFDKNSYWDDDATPDVSLSEYVKLDTVCVINKPEEGPIR